MKRYFVHVYHEMRSKFAVDAESQPDAIVKVDDMFGKTAPSFNINGLVSTSAELSTHDTAGIGHLCSEDTSQVVGYLVDEVGDAEHVETMAYNASREPATDSPCSISLTNAERDTVLAALRFWQRLGGSKTEEWDVATNGGSHGGLNGSSIDAICDRMN